MSKTLLAEVKAAEAQKAEKEQHIEGEGEQEKPSEKESSSKDKQTENRDWKRNGACLEFVSRLHSLIVPQMSAGSSGSTQKLRC